MKKKARGPSGPCVQNEARFKKNIGVRRVACAVDWFVPGGRGKTYCRFRWGKKSLI